MKIFPKNRSRLAAQAATIIAASGIAAYALAAPDYDRIRKDINIMIGVVKSSFENSPECRSCNVRVTGHYLADQGVVFNVEPSSGHRYAFRSHDFEDEIEVFAEGMAAIPIFVQDILTEVQVNLDNEDFTSSLSIMNGDDEELNIGSREAQHALREARVGIREAIRELRELDIEAIHADKEELKELEMKETEIENEVAKLEAEENKIKENLASHIEKRTVQMEIMKAKRAEEKRKEFEEMETLVLNTFCDYSATIRNLPSNERVSVIVNKDDDRSNIYVFEQSALKGCDSSKSDVRDHALSYPF
jgi:hypothetical protein